MRSRLLTDKLFAAGRFRFSLGISSLEGTDFFRNGEEGRLLGLRQAVLLSNVDDYQQPIRDGNLWGDLQRFVSGVEPAARVDSMGRLGSSWEPDFVVVDRTWPHEVRGGCVCFPSGWSLKEKMGKSLFITHSPVPDLNDNLGANISALLSRIEIGHFFQRTNWGLSGSSQLDQHPRHGIPAIPAGADPDKVYLRVEWQALTGLSAEKLLFGIRVFQVPITELKQLPELSARLAENLETMPEPVARYKRLTECRREVVRYLRGIPQIYDK
jgi:dimethylamine monooxygenase subunit A